MLVQSAEMEAFFGIDCNNHFTNMGNNKSMRCPGKNDAETFDSNSNLNVDCIT